MFGCSAIMVCDLDDDDFVDDDDDIDDEYDGKDSDDDDVGDDDFGSRSWQLFTFSGDVKERKLWEIEKLEEFCTTGLLNHRWSINY